LTILPPPVGSLWLALAAVHGQNADKDRHVVKRKEIGPRPSAPKAGHTFYGNLLKSSENKWFL
jgi:hypothetical protein